MDFYHRRCNSRRTPAGSFARWRIWAQSMPVWPVLTSLTHRQQLPPAVYVLIAIDISTPRTAPTNCRVMDFWLAAQQELHLVKAIAPFSDRADRTVVAAGRVLVGFPRCMPDCTGLNAGCVLSQSDCTGGRIGAGSKRACYLKS